MTMDSGPGQPKQAWSSSMSPSSPYLPDFDRLYVISDLHMGGEGEFKIFHQAPRLAAFIDHVGSQSSDGVEVGLVLNGDVVDFLAEPKDTCVAVSEERADYHINRILKDEGFKPVFDALARFVARKHTHLVIVIGNHDIELALPVVQRRITEVLTDARDYRRRQLTFAITGAGYACLVGGVRVFCTHGNEFDDVNFVDTEFLRQLARLMNEGRALDRTHLAPNAGSRVVIEVMNKIKREWPFIDLLKPITVSVLTWLEALTAEGAVRPSIDWSSLAVSFAGAGAGHLHRHRLLGGADGTPMPTLPTLPRWNTGPAPTEDDLLRRADLGTLGPTVLVSEAEEVLGWQETVSKAWEVLTQAAPRLSLHALTRLFAEDCEPRFELCKSDKPLEALLAEHIGPGVVVAGHTHRARSISMGEKRLYLNTGTWIDLLRVTRPTVIEHYEAVHAALMRKTWAELRQATLGPDGPPLLYTFTTAARIRRLDSGDVVAGLVEIRDAEPAAPGSGLEVVEEVLAEREVGR